MASVSEIDALYGLPLEAFTTARNDLARGLRKDGRREEADEVAALRKPSLPAWVVNQLARERSTDVRALVSSADAIKAGRDGADERFREALDALVRAARDLISETGRTASDAVLRQVATTLRASAAAAPEELQAGRLTEAREASGFDALAGAATRPARGKIAKAKPPASPKVDRAAVDAARRALTEARDEAREHRRRVAAAERETQRAREALDDAETRVADAERHLESLRSTRS
jgi:hypothetical protein